MTIPKFILLANERDPMYYLKNVDMMNDTEYIATAQSTYILIRYISASVIVISILISAVVYACATKGEKKSSSLSNIFRKCVFAVVLSSIPFILTVLYGLFTSFI